MDERPIAKLVWWLPASSCGPGNSLVGTSARGAYVIAIMNSRNPDPPPHSGNTEETIDFGFAEVPRDEKKSLVGDVFSGVAGDYDLMNDLMSGGVHRLWKAALIDRLRPRPGMFLLDVAGGTGDVARAFASHISQQSKEMDGDRAPSAGWVCDINFSMTRAGRDRAIDKPIDTDVDIRWICGNAEQLPMPDRSVDAVTIAFGLRNVTDRAAAIAEARRVLRPGGQYLILEFSPVTQPLLADIYDAYSFRVLPEIGHFVARNRDAYRYLVESIRRFPDPDTLNAMIEQQGFGQVSYQLLSGGVAAIHSGWRT